MTILYCIIANIITLAIIYFVLSYVLSKNKDKINQENSQMFEYLMTFQTKLEEIFNKLENLTTTENGEGNNN